MTSHFLSPILFYFVVIVVLPALFLISVCRLATGQEMPRLKRRLWSTVCVISILPILGIAALILLLVVGNYPFKSGIVADALGPGSVEVCIVQTFKGFGEPYQVSLYAHKPGSPWIYNYLAHQDWRWRNCRVEFAGNELRIYNNGDLRKTLSLAEAIAEPSFREDELPSNYTPEQILQYHNKKFQQ